MNRSPFGWTLILVVISCGWMPGPSIFAASEGPAVSTETSSSGWFLVRERETEMRGAPASAPGYPVAVLAAGTPVHLEGTPVDGWSMVKPEGPAFDDVRALVEVDERVVVDGRSVTAMEPTTVYALNLRSRIDTDTYLPARSWMELASIDRGRSLDAERVFDMDGSTWAIVTPPSGTRLWVNTAKLRPATETEQAKIDTMMANAPTPPPASPDSLRRVLARPAEPAVTMVEPILSVDENGDWFVSNRNDLAVRSAPLDRPSYTVRTLEKGEPLLVVDIVDGSAVVALRGAIGDVPGILQLDGRVEVVGDTAHIVGPTEIRTPNLNAALADGTFNPARCWQTMAEPQPGDTLKVRKRFTANNREWLLVTPPPDVTLDVLLGQLRPARAEEIPTAMEERTWPPRPKPAVAAETPKVVPTPEPATPTPATPTPDPVAPVEMVDAIDVDDLAIEPEPAAPTEPVTIEEPVSIDLVESDPIEDPTTSTTPPPPVTEEPIAIEDPISIDVVEPEVVEVEMVEDRTPVKIDTPEPTEAPTTRENTTSAEAPASRERVEPEMTEPPAAQPATKTAPAAPAVTPAMTPGMTPGITPGSSQVDPEAEEILDLIDDPETPVIVEVVKDEIGTVESAPPPVREAPQDSPGRIFFDDPAENDMPARGDASPTDLEEGSWGVEVAPVQLPGGLSTRWGVSRSRNLELRSEPSMETGYVVAVVDRGDLVAVSGEDGDWLRVRLIGPELDNVRGLLRESPGGFHAYGKRLRVISGDHDVLAPNLREKLAGVRSAGGEEVVDPANAWVPLVTLKPGDEVVTTDSFVDRDGVTWYLVIPAQTAEVWSHRAFLRPALPAEMPSARGLDLAGRPNITDSPQRSGNVSRPGVFAGGMDLPDESKRPSTQPRATRPSNVAQIEPAEVETVELIDEPSEPAAPEVVEVETVELIEEPSEPVAPAAPEVVEVVEVETVELIEEPSESVAPATPEVVEVVEVIEPAEEPEILEVVEVETIEVVAPATETTTPQDAPAPTPTDEVETVIVVESQVAPEPAPLPLELFEDIDLADAEMMWNELRRGEKSAADLDAMRQVYAAIAARETVGEATRKRAELRRKQIEIQLKLQDRIESLRRLEDRNAADQERINSIREALLDRSDYNEIGRLGRSRIYDGRRLPKLYRLEDPTSGRTIAYVVPKDGLDLDQGLGRIVGVVGTERIDQMSGLRLISPHRFEIDLTETIPARKE